MKKRIHVVRRYPCGERSYYWEWVEAHGGQEPPEANPDVIADSSCDPGRIDDRSIARELLFRLKDLSLSVTEHIIVEKVIIYGEPIASVARYLGVSRPVIYRALKKIKNKLKKYFKN
ncbi:MAG: hypothetical protein QXH91_09730 [Candidatus Bathyarchaeia archaeon]